jgi:hypothetical protein
MVKPPKNDAVVPPNPKLSMFSWRPLCDMGPRSCANTADSQWHRSWLVL